MSETCPDCSGCALYECLDIAVLTPEGLAHEWDGVSPIRVGRLPNTGTRAMIVGWGATSVNTTTCEYEGAGLAPTAAYATIRSAPTLTSTTYACSVLTVNSVGHFLIGQDRNGRVTCSCSQQSVVCPLDSAPMGYGLPLLHDSGGAVLADINCGETCMGADSELRLIGVISHNQLLDDTHRAAGFGPWNVLHGLFGVPRIDTARDQDGDVDVSAYEIALFMDDVQSGECLRADIDCDGDVDADDVQVYYDWTLYGCDS
jgi:hypothetical protein